MKAAVAFEEVESTAIPDGGGREEKEEVNGGSEPSLPGTRGDEVAARAYMLLSVLLG